VDGRLDRRNNAVYSNFSSVDSTEFKYTLFFIRTSNFGAEAERSYFFFSI